MTDSKDRKAPLAQEDGIAPASTSQSASPMTGSADVQTSRKPQRSKLEQAVEVRDKLVHQAEQTLEKLAHGDPKQEEALKQFRDNNAQINRQAHERWYKRMLSTPISDKKLPIGVKVFGVLCILAALYGVGDTFFISITTVQAFMSGKMSELGTSTVVVTFIHLSILVLLFVGFFVFGIRLMQGKRVYAALVIYAIYVLVFGGAVCSLMLFGVSPRLAAYGALFGILIAFQIYLDPYLREERQLERMLRDNEIKHEQEAGVLGRDLSGKGYIQLNFFNLFWIFVVCSILGDAMESVFHVIVVDPGHWQDRAGLLFGPFSPIYGFGALLMTLFLNRIYKKNVLIIFLLSAIIGGLFEAFVSYFMQYTFGAVAWNYTGQFLSLFGGRTCGLAMCAWGALGVVWIKLLLPGLLWLIDKIPWNWRYGLTVAATAFMAVDCVMSLQALDCWYERMAHQPIDTPIQHFYATYFDNSFMSNRFQSMTIDPSSAIRG